MTRTSTLRTNWNVFLLRLMPAGTVPSECPYRALVMPVFFRILYTSGMRVSELRLAKIRDIDLANGCIRVLSGKNQKDRLVPIHPDLVSRCVELKDQIHSRSPEDEFFFMVRPGREMTLQNCTITSGGI